MTHVEISQKSGWWKSAGALSSIPAVWYGVACWALFLPPPDWDPWFLLKCIAAAGENVMAWQRYVATRDREERLWYHRFDAAQSHEELREFLELHPIVPPPAS